MFHIVNRRDQKKGAIAAVEFEGLPYGAASLSSMATLSQGEDRDFISIRIPKPASCFSGQAAMVVDGQKVIVVLAT